MLARGRADVHIKRRGEATFVEVGRWEVRQEVVAQKETHEHKVVNHALQIERGVARLMCLCSTGQVGAACGRA